MTDAIQKEAREAIRPHVAKRAAAHEQVYGTAMTMTEEDACCADFRVGYLAAATAREKELAQLRLMMDTALDALESRNAEIASLRAKLEAVPVEEIRAARVALEESEWGDDQYSTSEANRARDKALDACAIIDRWLAGLGK